MLWNYEDLDNGNAMMQYKFSKQLWYYCIEKDL